jgi:coenzyme F420-0:L-glutamate ligase/coenzyme F420-1:gamma-L-glutamate ligase
MIEIVALTGIPEIAPGDDLASILAEALARIEPRPHDILVVTQKIVSKSEGRFVDLAEIRPGAEAQRIAEDTGKDGRLVELVLRESSAVVRTGPNLLITRHRSGHVMANAGVDRSNLGSLDGDRALLLPEDSDASAQRLRDGLARRFDSPPAVVISDSFGRPWRQGVVNVAIGASGLPSLIDRRGERDRDGRLLEVTQIALADIVASAAGLATGEGAEGVPAALVRGFEWAFPEVPASALVRPVEEDLFR